MTEIREDARRYLDPKVLSKVGNLELIARLIVEGLISGLHRSPFHGFSVEFAQHREYAPGDEIKHVDWKVYSKTDRYYIKQYEQETNLKAYILMDVSESMRYGKIGNVTKFQYGCYLAAAIAFMLLQQQDQVGLVLFDDDIRKIIPPSGHPNHLRTMLHEFDSVEPRKKTDMEPLFHKLAEEIRRKGLVFLISDLFIPRDGLFRGLKHFRHRRHEVLLFHLMDQDELNFELDGNLLFKGMEQMGEVKVQPRALRQAYLEVVERYLTDVRRRCIAERIDYRLIDTGKPLDVALSAFLAQREAFSRSVAARR
jgi:uncharacterized protein (DUF58 family)